jgi:hypothetical protein
MKQTIKWALIGLGALTLAVSQATAQTSIQQLQQISGIRISGVVRSVVGNQFTLDDGTGQLIVDAGPRWYQAIDLVEGEAITVVGEYDNGELDAHRITRSNGDTIVIREASGPPPWAGGRDRLN